MRNPDVTAKEPRLTLRRFTLLVLCVLCAAPTPGDIGGCGKRAELLDAELFFAKKYALDCSACQVCGVDNDTCDWACDPNNAPSEFPLGCFPLVHDGEVCLRALTYSDCDEYRGYLDDQAPTVPSECNFCPAREGEPQTDAGGGDE